MRLKDEGLENEDARMLRRSRQTPTACSSSCHPFSCIPFYAGQKSCSSAHARGYILLPLRGGQNVVQTSNRDLRFSVAEFTKSFVRLTHAPRISRRVSLAENASPHCILLLHGRRPTACCQPPKPPSMSDDRRDVRTMMVVATRNLPFRDSGHSGCAVYRNVRL